ncbi:hypothetical protein KSS87_019240 [Heliosperma pusillum]|nr:hypothetical protein KSS87_019240 [Heliosperma pusillum]
MGIKRLKSLKPNSPSANMLLGAKTNYGSFVATGNPFDFWRHSVNRPPTPDAGDDQEKELTLQEKINIKLIESGEKERLMDLLRERLVECGWKDEMNSLCRLSMNEKHQAHLKACVVHAIMRHRQLVKKKGRDNVTVDDLVHVITPKGRASVPDSVKAELLKRIWSFLNAAAI